MWAVRFWMLPSASGDQLGDPLPLLVWEVVCHPAPALNFCCLSRSYSLRVLCWEFCSLPHPFLQGSFQILPQPPLLVLDYSLLFLCLIFVWEFQSAQGMHWLMFPGVGREVMHGAWCSPVHLPNHTQACLESVVAGRNGVNFSQHSVA
jgi:hypothetical protein